MHRRGAGVAAIKKKNLAQVQVEACFMQEKI